ncbi:MAG: transcription antitermination factor NusB [Candidatus Merdivicinus sp.]|jgi:N utilization substance protein B
MKKISRHQMRENAFILVFEKIFTEDSVEEILQTARECEEMEITEEVETMFRGVQQNLEAIDTTVEPYLKKWTKDRISKVSLAILRLGVYEMIYQTGVEDDIIVSECVKLATTFAHEDDVAFVNGVLGNIVRSRKKA